MYPITPSAALLLLTAKDHPRRKGLNDENYLSPASREKCFLLTLPYIEPAMKDRAKVVERLHKANVNVRVAEDFLRVSPSVFNDMGGIDKLLEALS